MESSKAILCMSFAYPMTGLPGHRKSISIATVLVHRVWCGRRLKNTLALGYVIPAIRAYSGLSPVRQCSCRAYKEKSCKSFDLQDSAEREGFEPPVPLSTAVFKTAVIDHSTISPNIWLVRNLFQMAFVLKSDAKVRTFFETSKYFRYFFSKILFFPCFSPFYLVA